MLPTLALIVALTAPPAAGKVPLMAQRGALPVLPPKIEFPPVSSIFDFDAEIQNIERRIVRLRELNAPPNIIASNEELLQLFREAKEKYK
jgi:hypothetical protein